MMRVLFILRRLDCGGAERQLIELIKGLDKGNFEIFLLCLYPGGAFWDEASSIADISIAHLGKRGRWDVGVIRALWKYMRQVRPHVVHGYMGIGNVLALAGKVIGCKVVWGVRGSKVDFSHYDFGYRLMSWAQRLASRVPDLIICNSEAARRELVVNGYPPKRIRVIFNGIDIERFRPDPVRRDAMRAEWGVASREFLIGLIARFDPVKGHRVFLLAASRILARHANVKFVVVGDGSERRRRAVRGFAHELGLADRIIWAGERLDVSAVLPALDLSVSASLSEGFPNALGESMSCGVPCVATDVGDSARILGNLGWIAVPGNDVELTGQIEAAIQFCRTQEFRPELIRRHIELEFSVDRLVANTTAALRLLTVSGT